jgi:menaquinol-cytochrome c reductase iron-sulfur subunit
VLFRSVSFVETAQDAYNYAQVPHSVYVVKRSDTDIVVYSPVCPHLGCQVFFDRLKKEYVCPCHGSVFGSDGARISGPTPRGLDVLPSKIDQGGVWVQWVQYQPGIAAKTPV